jgi:hypothetical protein
MMGMLSSTMFDFSSIILETDPSIISARVSKANYDISSIPMADQTLSQVWKQAQEQLTRSFLSGK